jgi:hypothetical protein
MPTRKPVPSLDSLVNQRIAHLQKLQDRRSKLVADLGTLDAEITAELNGHSAPISLSGKSAAPNVKPLAQFKAKRKYAFKNRKSPAVSSNAVVAPLDAEGANGPQEKVEPPKRDKLKNVLRDLLRGSPPMNSATLAQRLEASGYKSKATGSALSNVVYQALTQNPDMFVKTRLGNVALFSNKAI